VKIGQLANLINDDLLTVNRLRLELDACLFLVNMRSFDSLKDFVGLFHINLSKSIVNSGKFLHDLDILASGLFVAASIPLGLRSEVHCDSIELFVQLSLQVVEATINCLLDHGQIALPSCIWIV